MTSLTDLICCLTRVHYLQEEMQCCEEDVVGAVTRLQCDGMLSVRWADGCISLCFPEQLMLVANLVGGARCLAYSAGV